MSTTDRPRPAMLTPALPVAAVVVDSGLPHLDREFEYAVPPELDSLAQPGVRVKIRFAGREVDGFVTARRATATHAGRLTPLRKVVSPEPVLTPDLIETARAVATRYAGVLGDVLRLAVPKRHAAAEKALPLEPPVPPAPPVTPAPPVPAPAMSSTSPMSSTATTTSAAPDQTVGTVRAGKSGPWSAYPAGPAFLRRIAAGQAPAAAVLALSGRPAGSDWPDLFALAAREALNAGRGALLVVPDHRDLDRVDAALTRVLGKGQHVRLSAEQGPQARYTAWLRALRGHVRCVVGTRAAAFAPVRDLGLVGWWDDGDDLHEEPRAPYPQVGEVLTIRAGLTGAALLTAGFSRSVEVQQRVDAGEWASVGAPGEVLRQAAPAVSIAGEGHDLERDGLAARAHLPSAAWRLARTALERGPVLVQVPRRGYLPALACQVCRTPARCVVCHGPMAVAIPGAAASCRWCGKGWGAAGFECVECGNNTLRRSVTGARRTAEELGRAFPGVPVVTSGAGEVRASVSSEPTLVIATPGAEPVADGGYAAALLLDAWALLDRADLNASIEALRRWTGAAALVHPRSSGGAVVLAGVPEGPTSLAVEALVRWDPAWLAQRELDERRVLSLPPAVRVARLVGSRRALDEAVSAIRQSVDVDVLGPLPIPDHGSGEPAKHQTIVRVPLARGAALAASLAAVRSTRSARKDPEPLNIQVDSVGDA